MTNKKFLSELKKAIDRVGKERDKLRVLREDAEAVEETCARAYEALEEAICALSEQV